jgi:hypothetical protein
MFEDVIVKVGTSLLNNNSIHYNYKAMFANITSFSREVKDGILQNHGFYGDQNNTDNNGPGRIKILHAQRNEIN